MRFQSFLTNICQSGKHSGMKHGAVQMHALKIWRFCVKTEPHWWKWDAKEELSGEIDSLQVEPFTNESLTRIVKNTYLLLTLTCVPCLLRPFWVIRARFECFCRYICNSFFQTDRFTLSATLSTNFTHDYSHVCSRMSKPALVCAQQNASTRHTHTHVSHGSMYLDLNCTTTRAHYSCTQGWNSYHFSSSQWNFHRAAVNALNEKLSVWEKIICQPEWVWTLRPKDVTHIQYIVLQAENQVVWMSEPGVIRHPCRLIRGDWRWGLTGISMAPNPWMTHMCGPHSPWGVWSFWDGSNFFWSFRKAKVSTNNGQKAGTQWEGTV